MSESGFLRYTRSVYVHLKKGSSRAIMHHHKHLKTLDRVHTLTLHPIDSFSLRVSQPKGLSFFYQTLTTLRLNLPLGLHRNIPAFIIQFPNLENLDLELYLKRDFPCHTEVFQVQSPPLRGHLRCGGIYKGDYVLPRTLAYGFPNGINFQFIEFEDVYWKRGQHLLRGCKNTLKEFTVTVDGDGKKPTLSFSLAYPYLWLRWDP